MLPMPLQNVLEMAKTTDENGLEVPDNESSNTEMTDCNARMAGINNNLSDILQVQVTIENRNIELQQRTDDVTL